MSESLKDELRAIYFYLLAAYGAPTPATRQFAREEEQHFGHLVEWIEWEDDPELQAPLQKIRLLHTVRPITPNRDGQRRIIPEGLPSF